LYLGRSVEMVVGLLGTLKAGGAYLPLDAESPLERTSYILDDAGVVVALTERKLEERLPAFWGQTVCLDEEWGRIEAESEIMPDRAQWNGLESEIGEENLAYVIYTSGSSGRPKGVMVNHGGLANYLQWASEAYRVEDGEGAPVSSSISFDLTVTSLYLPLINGKSVNLLSEEEGFEALAEALSEERGYSLVKITPAHLEVLEKQLGDREVKGGARTLVIGGEELKAGRLKYWRERAKGTRLINEYGPTETVVGCCVYEVNGSEGESEPVPIGRPIANTRLYILDRELNPAPLRVRGELYISGEGVARGYIGKPELTADRFIPNPVSGKVGERVYGTGDVVRYLSDGNIQFEGRADNQVKIRGYRIELGEIEARLSSHPEVSETVVLAREEGEGGKKLVAYYTGREIGAESLRAHLAGALPDYMVPSAYVHIEKLPLTPNGKLDRRALPGPEGGAYATRGYEAPVGETERRLAQIWADVLELERVGRNDNFFELGGHSLLVIIVIERMRREGMYADVRALFTAPTLTEFAAATEDMEVVL
jgi:amino acid adenylation domain-containing protein